MIHIRRGQVEALGEIEVEEFAEQRADLFLAAGLYGTGRDRKQIIYSCIRATWRGFRLGFIEEEQLHHYLLLLAMHDGEPMEEPSWLVDVFGDVDMDPTLRLEFARATGESIFNRSDPRQ